MFTCLDKLEDRLGRQRCLVDYKSLWGYTREPYQCPDVADTVNCDHIKQHYCCSHQCINPNGVVPLGQILDLGRAHLV